MAEVIYGKSDRGTVEGIRARLKNGTLVGAVRKIGGRYVVPIGPLAAALDGLVDPEPDAHLRARPSRHTVVVGLPQPTRRGRVPDAVRLGKIKAWSELVLTALDEIDRRIKLPVAKDEARRLDEVLGRAQPVRRTPR